MRVGGVEPALQQLPSAAVADRSRERQERWLARASLGQPPFGPLDVSVLVLRLGARHD
jgi:hypothetical protein